MARISKYQFDQEVTKDDFVIGSDGKTKVTRNYKLEDLAVFLGKQDAVLGNKFSYTYDQISAYADLADGKISFNNKNITDTPFSGITTIYLNRYNNSGFDVYEVLNILQQTDSVLKIYSNADSTKQGIYTIQSVNVFQNDVIILSVTARIAIGTITDKDTLLLEADFRIISQTYTHIQIAASQTWQITHSLGEKPGVTIVDDGDNVIFGDIQYIDDNELIINFASSVSGKAYLN